jgi:hypothetical protein
MLPQVWRLVTAFFITKKQFGILMDPYFCMPYAPRFYALTELHSNILQCISMAAASSESRRGSRSPATSSCIRPSVGCSSLYVILLLSSPLHIAHCTHRRQITSYICPPSLVLAVAVLKLRKSTLARLTLRHSQNIKGVLRRVSMVGSHLRSTTDSQFRMCGIGSLHFYITNTKFLICI